MRVLVTGATGFIGREIVSELEKNDHRVIALGRSQKIQGVNLLNTTVFQADITDYENLLDLEKVGETDAVIHAAGLAHQFGETTKEEFNRVNVVGTENILKLAGKLRVKHFILIGSTAVYGIAQGRQSSQAKVPIIDEESTVAPQTLYARSKLESEKICRRICEEKNIALTIFRLAPVIGEGNVGNVARLIGAIDKNRFIWIGYGDNLKSLIDKRDVARACAVLLSKKRSATEIFNLAAEPVLMKDFVNQIAVRLNKKISPATIPATWLRTIFKVNAKFLQSKKIEKISDTVEKWLSDDIYSADKIARIYGYQAQTKISEALAKQVDYYSKNKNRADK